MSVTDNPTAEFNGVPTAKMFGAIEKFTAQPELAAFRAQLDATVPMPNRPEMAATWEPMARALRRVSRGAMLPADALKAAQQEYAIVTRPPPEEADARHCLRL